MKSMRIFQDVKCPKDTQQCAPVGIKCFSTNCAPIPSCKSKVSVKLLVLCRAIT